MTEHLSSHKRQILCALVRLLNRADNAELAAVTGLSQSVAAQNLIRLAGPHQGWILRTEWNRPGGHYYWRLTISDPLVGF